MSGKQKSKSTKKSTKTAKFQERKKPNKPSVKPRATAKVSEGFELKSLLTNFKRTFIGLKTKTSEKIKSSKIEKYLRMIRNSLANHRDLYPVLVFSVIPTLFFWTQNNIQELGISIMTRALLVAILVGAVFYLFWYFVFTKDKFKASVMAVVTIIATFSYGQILEIYQGPAESIFGKKSDLASEGTFLVVLAAVYFGVAYLIKTKLKFSKQVRGYLALFATVLLVLNMFPLVKHWATNFGVDKVAFGPEIKVTKSVSDKPDIYYLIFDRYGSQHTLKDVYGFDNTPFLGGLKDKGFYVAADSAANYPFTTFSLTTSLNMSYIPDGFKERSDSGLYYTLMKDKMENNKAALFLKSQGYKFINIGPWWNPTKYNKNADKDAYYPSGPVFMNRKVDLKEHELILFQDTILWPLFRQKIQVNDKKIIGMSVPQSKESTARIIHRESIFHQLDQLKKTSFDEGPKFTFAHFLFPHDPYVLDENCKTFTSRYTDEYKVYINQLKCANQKIKEAVDYILSNSKKDPIIIIQADEGPYPKSFRANKDLDWNTAPVQEVRQKARILNSYYFPDRNYTKLYQDISPVNSFRLVFNQYLGTNLPMLPDYHYFPESPSKRFFLNDFTDKFKQ